jgi:hypothetical protein
MGPHGDYPGPRGHQGEDDISAAEAARLLTEAFRSKQAPAGLNRVYVTWYLPEHVNPQTTQVDIDLLPAFMGIVLPMGATITDVI